MQIIEDIRGVFVLPIKKWYFGKIKYYTPYFEPINFNSNIVFIRKLKLKTNKELQEYIERYPHFKSKAEALFSNLPMVRRNKNWTFKLLNQWWHIQIGWPVAIAKSELGWKDKFESPRFEWSPFWQLWLFKWQLCIHWIAPIESDDAYWEQVLWYVKYSSRDIRKAKETWPWSRDGVSSWDDSILIQKPKDSGTTQII